MLADQSWGAESTGSPQILSETSGMLSPLVGNLGKVKSLCLEEKTEESTKECWDWNCICFGRREGILKRDSVFFSLATTPFETVAFKKLDFPHESYTGRRKRLSS